MAYPTDRRYTEDHEWIQPTVGGRAKIGITDFAQKQVGDIVLVQLPQVGNSLAKGDPLGTIDAVNALQADVYAPAAGKVTAINGDLGSAPEEINEDANNTWFVEIQMSNPKDVDSLLSAAEYEAYIAERQ